MTLNRQRLQRYTGIRRRFCLCCGVQSQPWLPRQLVYGCLHLLSVAADSKTLVNRRQPWELQIEQRLAQTTTQIGTKLR